VRLFGPGKPKSPQQQIEDKETQEGKTRPIPWKPLYVVGAIVVFFVFIFSCGTVLFFFSTPELPEDPTPVPRPRSAEEYIFRGIDYADQGDLQSALADFTEAIRLNPKLTQAYYNRGVTYNKMERYDEAVQDFTTILLLNPKHEGALVNRALGYTLLGMDAQAEADVVRAVELGVDEAELRARIEGARLSREPTSP